MPAADDVRRLSRDVKRANRPIRVVENSGLTIRDEPNGWLIGTDVRRFQKKAPESIVPTQLLQITQATAAEYMQALAWDGETASGETIHVAKPWFLRGSITWSGETREGVRYFYGFGDNQKRNAAKSGETEVQTIVPKYAIGDIILAVRSITGVTRRREPGNRDVIVKWADVNVDGRMWMVLPT